MNVTLTLQLAVAARLAPQLLVWKSPLADMLVIFRATLPVLVSVKVRAVEVDPQECRER